MKKRNILMILIIIFCLSVPAFAGNDKNIPNYVPVSELRVGQIITGYTVVNGIMPEKFTAKIIGFRTERFFSESEATKNIYAIVISGPCLPGILSGMSGSTILSKDGRIIGLAAANIIGASPLSPIFIINPMEEIIKHAPKKGKGAKKIKNKQGTAGTTGLLNNKVTLYTNGFNKNVFAKIFPHFDVINNASVNEKKTVPNLKLKLVPGSAINCYMVWGDLESYFHGTIGYIIPKDKKDETNNHFSAFFGAFGHSCLGKGIVRVPIKQASVIGLMYRESFLNDFKIIGDAVTDFIGEVTYDRFSVYGGLYPTSKKKVDIDNVVVKQHFFNQKKTLGEKKCYVVKIPGMTVDLITSVLVSVYASYYWNCRETAKTVEYQIIFNSKNITLEINRTFKSGSIWGFLFVAQDIFEHLKKLDLLEGLKSIEVNANFSDRPMPPKPEGKGSESKGKMSITNK